MADKKFQVGDLVWGKMRSYPPWPARVLDQPKDKMVHVYFFGTKNHAFLNRDFVTHHSRSMLASCKRKKMSLSLRAAVEEIEQASGVHSVRSGDVHTMGRRPATLTASLKVQLKLKYQKLKKRKAILLKSRVSKKKAPEPRVSRPTDTPYNLRSKAVPEPIPEVVPELFPEVVREPIPQAVLESIPEPVSLPPWMLPAPCRPKICGLCSDSKGATDKHVTTPCCGDLFHMSCILSWNKKYVRTRCPECRKPLEIGLRVQMVENNRIDFAYEFRRYSGEGLWVAC